MRIWLSRFVGLTRASRLWYELSKELPARCTSQLHSYDGRVTLLGQPGQKNIKVPKDGLSFEVDIKRPNEVAVVDNKKLNTDAPNIKHRNVFKIISYQDNFITVRSQTSVKNVRIGEEMPDGKILKSIGANSYSAE